MTDTAKKMPLLETRGLKKTFGTLEVLKGVDMHIQKERCSPSSARQAAAKAPCSGA